MNGSSSPLPLVLVADATAAVGAGHAMRLVPLAEAWLELDIGPVQLVGTVDIGFVQVRLDSAAVRVLPALARIQERGVVVVDTYDESRRILCGRVGSPPVRILVDDLGGDIPAGYDAVWNPNAYGTTSLYPSFAGPVITGMDAVPIRTDLPKWAPAEERSIGVILGGGTVASHLAQAIQGLSESNPNLSFRAVGDWCPPNADPIPAASPWDALARCDSLITAGGSTMWEAAAVGIPVVVVRTAANQDLASDWARDNGVPVVDAARILDPDDLTDVLDSAISRPVHLPHLASGAHRVAGFVLSLATAGIRQWV